MKNGIRFSVKAAKHTRTRIMATVGPKTLKRETLRAMVEEGASFFRFNGAHIDKDAAEEGQIRYTDAEEVVEIIKDLRNELHQVIGIYFDLGGPKMRVQNVLAVDTRPRKNPDEDWLHPEPGVEVWIRPYDEREEQRFDQALDRFTKEEGIDKQRFWDPSEKVQDKVRKFFGRLSKNLRT